MSFFIKGADNKLVNMEESNILMNVCSKKILTLAVKPVLHWVRLPQDVHDQDLADGHQAGARGGQHGPADRRVRHPGQEHLRRHHGGLCANLPDEHHQSGLILFIERYNVAGKSPKYI